LHHPDSDTSTHRARLEMVEYFFFGLLLLSWMLLFKPNKREGERFLSMGRRRRCYRSPFSGRLNTFWVFWGPRVGAKNIEKQLWMMMANGRTDILTHHRRIKSFSLAWQRLLTNSSEYFRSTFDGVCNRSIYHPDGPPHFISQPRLYSANQNTFENFILSNFNSSRAQHS
jgi:hypothetical protein